MRPGEPGGKEEGRGPEREDRFPMAPVKVMARQAAAASPGIEHAIRSVNQPDGEHEQNRRRSIDGDVKTSGEEKLPHQGDKRRIQAQQVRPEPDFRSSRGGCPDGSQRTIMRLRVGELRRVRELKLELILENVRRFPV